MVQRKAEPTDYFFGAISWLDTGGIQKKWVLFQLSK